MTSVAQIRDSLLQRVPAYMKLDFDNVGHLVGRSSREVKTALVSLDITLPVIREAAALGASLIVSHHPVIFHPLKQVTEDDTTGEKLLELIQNDISAICLHTNLDTADGGVNDALLQVLGLQNGVMFDPHGTHPDGRPYGIGRIGTLEAPVSMAQFLPHVKAALHANGLRYHDAGKPVQRVACCGGSGGSMIPAVLAAGCDTFVTGDVKYDQFLEAKARGLNLIDADHFCTEQPVVPVLAAMLREAHPEIAVHISKVHHQTAQFI